MKLATPSPVRIQCHVAQRLRRDRTSESERPPRKKDSFAPAKKIGYVAITPIAERAAMSSHRRRLGGPNQHATTAATEVAIPATPSGIISRPMRCECDANQAWKSPGERVFQKLTNETPITSMPPARKPSTRLVSITSVDVATHRYVTIRSPSESPRPPSAADGSHGPVRGSDHRLSRRELVYQRDRIPDRRM